MDEVHPAYSPVLHFRLLDIVHADQKLYLVFEFLDVDLKRYMETGNQNRTPITLDIVKVSIHAMFPPFRWLRL
jgi:hypothetical protein